MKEPLRIKHKDQDCQLLIDCMEDSMFSGNLLVDIDEADNFYEVINWIKAQKCFKDLVNLQKDKHWYITEPIRSRIEECKERCKVILKLTEQREKNNKSINCLAYSYIPPLGHSYILYKFLELSK